MGNYEGFKKLKARLAKNPKVDNPGAVAASIGREKYGKKAFQSHAASGTSMKNVTPKKKFGY